VPEKCHARGDGVLLLLLLWRREGGDWRSAQYFIVCLARERRETGAKGGCRTAIVVASEPHVRGVVHVWSTITSGLQHARPLATREKRRARAIIINSFDSFGTQIKREKKSVVVSLTSSAPPVWHLW
jgi:hypothetical protein